MLIKYSQNYNYFVFYFVSIEVATAALEIFCVMIPSLVDTSLDFGLFRVVRPCVTDAVWCTCCSDVTCVCVTGAVWCTCSSDVTCVFLQVLSGVHVVVTARVFVLHTCGLTTPNASPIETHINCLNSAGRFHHFSPY